MVLFVELFSSSESVFHLLSKICNKQMVEFIAIRENGELWSLTSIMDSKDSVIILKSEYIYFLSNIYYDLVLVWSKLTLGTWYEGKVTGGWEGCTARFCTKGVSESQSSSVTLVHFPICHNFLGHFGQHSSVQCPLKTVFMCGEIFWLSYTLKVKPT